MGCGNGTEAGAHRHTGQSERTVLLHHAQKLDDDLRAGTDQDLTLASFLRVVNGVERIIKDTCLDHYGGCACTEILNSAEGGEVSVSREEYRY